MQISRYYKYIVRFYIAYLVPVVTYFSLVIFSCFIDTSDQRQTEFFGLLMIILFLISVIYYIWYIAHSKKRLLLVYSYNMEKITFFYGIT